MYSLFAGEDLRTLLDGFMTQAEAMGMLFRAAGGLIEAQDEALAAALSRAAAEPAGLQSLGLMGSLGGVTKMLDEADGTSVLGGYGRVGPEDVSGTPLERIAAAAQALEPGQFDEVNDRVSTVSSTLRDAATQLKADLDTVLGSAWQGETADRARDAVRGLTESAQHLSDDLDKVATKASFVREGFSITRTRVGEQAALVAEDSGSSFSGRMGVSEVTDSLRRAEAAEQARAIVNTEYSPAVMDANLDDLDFTAAYRVVSGAGLGGPDGIDMLGVWNTDGIPRPASAAAPSAEALAAASGGGAGAAGGFAVAGSELGPGTGADAATEQALLAARAGGADGAGAGVGGPGAGAGASGAGPGVNASTSAAGAPVAPVAGGAGAGQSAGAGGGIRGIRGGTASGRRRDGERGFGTAAGLVGGGGAAAAGAAATRLGGAGTLAGIGAGGGAAGGSAGGPAAAGGGAAGANPGAGAGAGTGVARPGGVGVGSAMGSSSTMGAATRPGAVPMGAMGAGAGAGQNQDRREHRPASYLTNATNTNAIIGDPHKVSPAIIGRRDPEPTTDTTAAGDAPDQQYRGRILGREYTGRSR